MYVFLYRLQNILFVISYVVEVSPEQGWEIMENVENVYEQPCDAILTEVQTFYERMWIAEGRTISYLKLHI